MSKISRRSFIKTSATTAAGLALAPKDILSKNVKNLSQNSPYDAKNLPTTILGNTGVVVPRMAFGLGSRFCGAGEEESVKLLEYAFKSGLYYWDTANDYKSNDGKVISEERVGIALKNKRDKIFLSTKVIHRDPNQAMKSIEQSLKRLQTDHFDVLNIHSVNTIEDNKELLKRGGLIDVLYRMKEEGITRFIGMSGHSDPAALTEIIEKANLDTVLVAMNHYPGGHQAVPRIDQVIPKAKEKNMGTLLMKVIRPLDTIKGLSAEGLLRYALSLEGVDCVNIGMDSLDVLNANLKTLREFTPMSYHEKHEMTLALAPFFKSESLPWLDTNYRDGNWII